ncbi:FAD-binding oxidoreductase [Actinomadura sp. KC06]|uniref:NAD(P)/FAD-dependent oxidoreductase n=1 Tax=Actinomadura sp. KC06 TaxID=2530369 RepID=UPI00104CAC58|nr:FAD-dependent oxidoreductase [Actinomadura sp. KC06]TDD25383.1 FAD-binding oxidoreductase [Actinomadura sp. KC06]
MRAVVIGGGLMGASAGYHLARAGLDVRILEAARPASGTTAVTFARLSAFDKEPRDYFRLNAEGMAEHAALASEAELPAWHHPCGSVLLAEDGAGDEGAGGVGDDGAGEADLARRADRFRAWGYPLTWEPAPDVGMAARLPGRVLHAPAEGWVDAVALTLHLLDRAVRHGAEIRPGTSVARLARTSTHWVVTTTGGEDVPADIVVNAAGQGAAALAASAGSSLTLTRSPGLLLTATTPGSHLRRIVHTPEVSIRPDGPGRVMIRSDQVDRALAGGRDARDLTGDLVSRAARVLPGLAAATGIGFGTGHRVLPQGGYPSIGGIPELPGYYEAVTHSGIILAPLVGRLLAEEITTGRVPPQLKPHRPAAKSH